ncbi:MAG: tetratricopeptide repeat protein [Woeseiaceae bacterium]|jgi:predicted CXXCH cytochrome family protein|nr:tetratricopeptide repeat protein [Woeseiaceae bacterium]
MNARNARPACRRPLFHLLVVACLAAGCSERAPETQSTAAAPAGPDPLERVGARATTGAAPGYLDDTVCGNCHRDIYDSYQHVGMSQSMKRPGNERPIEDFGVEYEHAPTHSIYRIIRAEDGLVFERYQRDANGEPINQLSLPIDWVIGSGNKVRSYAYQTDWGEMFMLPLSWYADAGAWAMSPGFEHAGHQGVTRKITRECLFCHNAYPEVPAGSDTFWETERFPATLPEGTGCQRCHGPGAEHVRTVVAGGSDVDTIRSKIVNPVRLSGEQRDSVCFQCHMLPSVSVVGARRIGRNDYSYRPGELLSDYLVHVEVSEEGISRADQFEINHHGYRFYLSRCYQESEGGLACISCHNPHEKPKSTVIRKTSSDVCLGCHATAESEHAAVTAYSADDCVTCHMPERRTSDVVEATMTDHRIATGPFDPAELVAPMAAHRRPITGIELLDFGDIPAGDSREYYRLAAIARANRYIETARKGLEAHLDRNSYLSPTPYIDLVRTQLQVGDYPAAEAALGQLLETYPNLHVGHTLLGTALLAQGKREAAIAALRQSLEIQPDPETWFNLAIAYLQAGNAGEAERAIDAAIELRPTMPQAWKYRGQLLMNKGQTASAVEAFRESLRLEPRDADAYRQLVIALRKAGRDEEARRYLEHGLTVASSPARLETLR